MAGEPEGRRRKAARAWGYLAWRPKTWRQATAQAVATGGLLVTLQLWFNLFSLPDARFPVWWAPLWLATSMAGYAFRGLLARRPVAFQETAPRR